MNALVDAVYTQKAPGMATSLDDFIAQGGLAERKIGTLHGFNLGFHTLTLSVPMHFPAKTSGTLKREISPSRRATSIC